MAHNEGLAAATLTVIVAGFSGLRGREIAPGWYVRFRSRQFDKRYSVHTAEAVSVRELDVSDAVRAQAVEYVPTQSADISLVLADLDITFEDFTFVDLGSGRGRVLVLAAQFPFSEVIGVEASPRLHDDAVKNIRSCTRLGIDRSRVRSVCADARDIPLPDGKLVLYMFNPFGREVLSAVLDRLDHSLATEPREVIVIYHNPIHQQLLDDAAFLRRRSAACRPSTVVFEHRQNQ